MTSPLPADVLSRLKAVLGPKGWSQDPERLAPKLVEWRDRWTGTTPILLLPASTAEVSAVVGICAESATPIVPQGGNTGLVAGQIPQGEVLLSLERMRAIRDIDTADDVLVAEAGAPLAAVHGAAEAVGRRFPLSLASEGSATVGGLISTNAGGTQVLRYGTMRELVLGIEAVLPNGEVFAGLKRLRKDNTGYDLKQLLIGAEGTLGVVTAASLKLFTPLVSRAVAFAGVDDPAAAVALLARAKAESGGAVESFELIAKIGVDFALRNIPGVRSPFSDAHPWYVLIEIASGEAGAAEAAMERLLAGALEDQLIRDAAIAQSQTQAADFWRLRESQSAAQKAEGAVWKHDVSAPVSKVAVFIAEATAAMERFAPGCRVLAFGHVGDGNIHFDVLQPAGADGAAHTARRDEAARIVDDIVDGLGGSISAEHGLGAMKTTEALRYKSPVEVAAMRAIRAALDPNRIMNPRVLF
jgi:FAD/FMN-containing dehydrogenase